MPVVTTQKYHTHNAKQFVESLTEGFRTYGANTITANANSTVLTISGNVFSTMRVGDILIVNTESRLINAIATNGTAVTVNSAFSTAITTQLFKTREQLVAYDSYYLFIGRSTPWANSDTTAETPTDSVGNSAYNYLRDTLAIRRITDADVVYVIPQNLWSNGSYYMMYDHRTNANAVLSNTTHFSYVRTSTNDVFKCLFNGRTSSDDSTIPASTSEPSLTDVASPSDIVTSSAENEKLYRWKYMYSLSSNDVDNFVTGDFMRVKDAADTIDAATGDVEADSSSGYLSFNDARNNGNGAIYEITVETGGSDYNPSAAPSVTIVGDGTGALASVVLLANVVTGINMIAYGRDYSYADVSITTSNSGSNATATAIISPRNTFTNTSGIHYVSNHSISNKDELYAQRLLLYVELSDDEGGRITTANEYRRIGILKNPLLTNREVATANVYDMSTVLTIATSEVFNKDEIVYQPLSGAYGVVVEHDAAILKLVHVSSAVFSANSSANTTIIGIGNGNTTSVRALSGNTVPTSLPGLFTDVVAASSTTAAVSAVVSPSIIPYTGEVLFVNHISPVVRGNNQTEAIRTILTF